MLKFFPTTQDVQKDAEVDDEILDFSRSETAFAMISILLAALANAFAVYSMKQFRYMFKRLAAMLYLITAFCIVVCLEVFKYSIEYEREKLPARHPKGSEISFDWSYGLCWVVFVIYIVAPIVMFITSRKRKGDKARTEGEAMENEPVILGRV
jgi:ABC-type xylose transport system permease subunit